MTTPGSNVPRHRALEGDALLSYGSRDTLDATGFAAGRTHATLRLSTTGGYHQSDAFGASDGEGTAGSARKQWSVGGSARFDPSARHRLVAAGDYIRLALDGVDAVAGGALLDRAQVQEQTSVRLSQRYEPSPRLRWENRAAYGQFRDQYLVDQRGGTALDDYEDRTTSSTRPGVSIFPRCSWRSSTHSRPAARARRRCTQFGLAEHRGELWVFGGLNYDPARQGPDAFGTCSISADAPFACPGSARLSGALVPAGGKLYLAGGSVRGSGADDGLRSAQDLLELDPASGAFRSVISQLPFDTRHMHAVAFQDRVLLISTHNDAVRMDVAIIDP